MIADLTDRDLRQRDVVPPEKLAACHALVIGVGAVGRQLALQLAAMGISAMTVVDHDVVDVVNLAPQGYAPQEIGQSKVEATASCCRRLNDQIVMYRHTQLFGRSSPKVLPCFAASDRRLAVFCCVDSITARGIVWETVRSRAAFFADARMTAEVVRVLTSGRPASDAYYATTLFSQDQAFAGACTSKSTIYTASIAAGLMLGQFTRWLRDMPVDRDLTLNLLASELSLA